MSVLRNRFIRIFLFAVAIPVFFLFQNCGIQQPAVEDSSFSSISPVFHKNMNESTKCLDCHSGSRPQVRTLNYTFDHSNPTWAAQDCITCHSSKDTWGVSWLKAQFPHDPMPATCLECHGNQMPRTNVYISNDSARPYLHTTGVECSTCHTSTSKFDKASDWRPAGAEPTGLVGSKTFAVNLIIPSFNGAIMVRPSPVSKVLKLEIDHGDSQVGNLACTTCHGGAASTGVFRGALFHRNIAANPTTCVQCHTNARPVGATGSQFFMRHEAVLWNSNSIGAVTRGTTMVVGTECATCHLNTPSMPQFGNSPAAGSRPFFGASFHGNTLNTSLSSCLDCHAHSRPSGSANFTDAVWRNKTNVGAPPFTTFDLGRHAPNVDCATCHRAPSTATSTIASWSGGYFTHSAATTNCLNCHTPSGITSTNHSGYASNCTTCHVGSTARFPNPVIADWKVNVTGGGVPAGVIGEKVIVNAVTCTGVQASLPNCQPSNPNVIAKGYDHLVNTAGVSCVNCHGSGAPSMVNGKFHRAPVGAVAWTAPAAVDLTNCNRCHDPGIIPANVSNIRALGIVGSQANNGAAAKPFAGVAHANTLIAGQQCSQCHTAPTAATGSNWNIATQIHARFTPAQMTSCSECHYKRMPSGLIARKNQPTYKGTNQPQKFTHTSSLSMPNVAAQQCATCHTNPGVSWTTTGRASFHNKVASTASCNTCHAAPLGNVTSTTTGVSFNHSTVPSTGDCASCHQPTLARISNRIPTAIDWDGGAAAPATYTIPSHTSSGITIPGYTGTHSPNPNCVSCHGTGNYSVITDFDHQGLPAGTNTCITCHLGSKAEVANYIAPTSGITMKTLGNRHHPVNAFKGTTLSCVGCHTTARGANTFTNANGIVYPTAARVGYTSIGCGSVNGTTYSCHEGNQRIMTVPVTTGTSGRWN